MPTLSSAFWGRIRLSKDEQSRCLETIRSLYAGYRVAEFEHQGYCSYTLLVSSLESEYLEDGDASAVAGSDDAGIELIIQLRPTQHKLSLPIAHAARSTYGSLVPSLRTVNIYLPGKLALYEMPRMKGTPLSRLLHLESWTGARGRKRRERLVESFASVLARAWPVAERASRHRRDSVVFPTSGPSWEEVEDFSPKCRGKVGARMTQKLAQLASELPDQSTRERARSTLERLSGIHDWPIVLTHGDLIPSNVLVDEETGEVVGLVDWTEAEWLPFGMCLYGLEYVVRSLQPQASAGQNPVEGWKFVYREDATRLRGLFYDTLLSLVPELGARKEDLEVMRDTGVLLWCGYAWDEGAIDRVVDEVSDGEELAKLRAFLDILV